MSIYHILNGDALLERFPVVLEGERVVMRECLVDGDVSGVELRELYATRARFISQNYEGFSEADYYQKTVPELEKIQRLPNGAEVNLWFEDDLFCQVNLWFVWYLLHSSKYQFKVYLVRPHTDLQYGFASLDEEGLVKAYDKRQHITADQLSTLAELWPLYQMHDHMGIMEIADTMETSLPFLLPTARAYIEMQPDSDDPGRPTRTLLAIMDELQTDDFGTIFKEFMKRESIYGFGDLQVKRLLDNITDSAESV